MTKQIEIESKSTIYDIFENTSNGRYHASRLEAKNFDEAVLLCKITSLRPTSIFESVLPSP